MVENSHISRENVFPNHGIAPNFEGEELSARPHTERLGIDGNASLGLLVRLDREAGGNRAKQRNVHDGALMGAVRMREFESAGLASARGKDTFATQRSEVIRNSSKTELKMRGDLSGSRGRVLGFNKGEDLLLATR